jgi:hypothetical protein
VNIFEIIFVSSWEQYWRNVDFLFFTSFFFCVDFIFHISMFNFFVFVFCFRLLDEIGVNGSLLTDMFPLLSTIIGQQPPVSSLQPNEAATRMDMVQTNIYKHRYIYTFM